MATFEDKTLTRAAAAITNFPNPLFYYGAPLELTIGDNECLAIPDDIASQVRDEQLRWGSPVAAAKRRAVYRCNRLGVDETKFGSVDDVEAFWLSVLAVIPPRPWVNIPKLLVHLATYKPMQKPSDSKPWKTASTRLDEIIRCGSGNHWANDTNFPDFLADEGHWEALRIIGDTHQGFGTFPSTLKNKLIQAGAAWVLVSPDVRIIPLCWEQWATRHGIPYTSSMPNMHIPKTPAPKRKRDLTSEVQPDNTPSHLSIGARSCDPQTPSRTMSRAVDTESPDDDTDVPADPFVTPNREAARTLQKLRNTTMSDNEDEDVWEQPATLADVVDMTKRAMKIQRTNIMRDVRALIRDAITDGPVEGCVREIIQDTLEEAGLENNTSLNITIDLVVERSMVGIRRKLGEVDWRLSNIEKSTTSTTGAPRSSPARDTTDPPGRKNLWS
ncbi:hypothetical protein F4861DRAFT_544551 [Xylaria intraflava]|nr:hypothetical protein F4861DRAFT_544551 [Xylaria intraflava]